LPPASPIELPVLNRDNQRYRFAVPGTVCVLQTLRGRSPVADALAEAQPGRKPEAGSRMSMLSF
jgi:hypothetical protein